MLLSRSCVAQRCAGTAVRENSNLPSKPTTHARSPKSPRLLHDIKRGRTIRSNLKTRTAAAAETTEAQPADPATIPDVAPAAQAASSPEPRRRVQQRGGKPEDTAPNSATIVVNEKPVTNAILRRLEAVPQTLLRAYRVDDTLTYKAVTAVAAAQRQLAASGKVMVYVPYTKTPQFTAEVFTAGSALTEELRDGVSLLVTANSSAVDLGRTLAFELLKHGGATVSSAGALATARAVAGMQLAREVLLRKGLEIGVVPEFVEAPGSRGQTITLLSQKVIIQELPPTEVPAPMGWNKPLGPTAAALASVLRKQGRVVVKIRTARISRLTQLLHETWQAQTAAAAAAAVEAPAAGDSPSDAADPDISSPRQGQKPRLLLVSYAGSSEAPRKVPVTGQRAQRRPRKAAAAAAADSPDAVTDASDMPSGDPSDAAAPVDTFVSLGFVRSRFTYIPEPQLGLAGPEGPALVRKPLVCTAASAVAGSARALSRKLEAFGAAWVYSDGSIAGNRCAWEAFLAVAQRAATTGARRSLLALVQVSEGSGPDGQPAAAGAGEQQLQEQASGAEEPQQPQEQWGGRQRGRRLQQQQQEPVEKFALSMLVVPEEDVAKSILQSPNAPLESSKVGFQSALQLLKFAAAANSFLPVSAASGTGGLVLLPAVLAATQEDDGAVDYRFAETRKGGVGQRYDYFFRTQRLTQELPGGLDGPEVQQLRVAATTDPSKLRDAIVAKILEQQPATLRFVAPVGVLPGLMMTVAMTAVAAARVRLQRKQSGVDVGVMPLVLPAGALQQEEQQQQEQEAAQAPSEPGQQLVVYSLRLVPMPPAVVEADGQQ